MRGLSDSNLDNLWRKAVRKKFNDRCFFCGAHLLNTELEAHHYIKRNNLLTRYDWRNGILLCKWTCHKEAHTKQGGRKIEDYLIEKDFYNYLTERETQSKQWFVRNGITKNDYLLTMYNELKEII